MRVAGFAVAGGRSQRMGGDKALLPWGEGDLLDHALERMTTATPDVRILAGAGARYTGRGFPVEVDRLPDLGPLGGLLTALECAPEAALLLGVDLPLVPSSLLARLATLIQAGDADAVVPVSPRGPEPLCAVYARSCREAVRRSVRDGALRMTGFWSAVRVRELSLDDLAVVGDPDEVFLNVNTPQDYERALSLA